MQIGNERNGIVPTDLICRTRGVQRSVDIPICQVGHHCKKEDAEKQKENKFRLEDFIRVRETRVKCKSKRGNVKDFLSKNINRLQLLVKDNVYDCKWEVSTQEIIFNHENQSSEDNDYNRSTVCFL